jgi:hypothetical protein
MATAGGLEIHAELAHAAPAQPEPVAQPGAEVELETAQPEPVERPPSAPPAREAWPPRPDRAAPVKTYAPVLRGFDPTVPLTAILVVAIFIAAVAAAVGRSANGPATSVSAAAVAPAGSPPNTARTEPASPPATSAPRAPGATTPLTQPPLFSQQPSAATAAAPPTAAQTGSCQAVVNALSTRSSPRTVDASNLMESHGLPGLPIPGAASATYKGVATISSLPDLAALGGSNDPEGPAVQKLLSQAGFLSMTAAELSTAGTPSSVVAFKFSSPAAAQNFSKGLLSLSCTDGIMQNPRPIPSLSRGITFVDNSGDLPYSASFVAGDTFFALGACGCARVPDSQALVGQWAQGIAARIGAV